MTVGTGFTSIGPDKPDAVSRQVGLKGRGTLLCLRGRHCLIKTNPDLGCSVTVLTGSPLLTTGSFVPLRCL